MKKYNVIVTAEIHTAFEAETAEQAIAKADEWEDVDVEDNSDEEEGKQSSPLKADSEPFSIITSDDKDTSKGAFTLIEGESDIKF